MAERRNTRSRTRQNSIGSSRSASGVASVSSRNSSNTSGSRPGLRRVVKKCLALDIEQIGGIKNLKGKKALQKLLDNSQHIDEYGPVGNPIRAQISNVVDRWKNLTKDEYLSRVIIKLGVFDSSSSSDEGSAVSKLSHDSSIADEEKKVPSQVPRVVSTDSKKKAATPKARPTRGATKGKAPSPIAETTAIESAQPYVFVSPTKKRVVDKQKDEDKPVKMTKYYPINVDLLKAEDNGPFTVYDIGQTLECVEEGDDKGRLFYGYLIVLPMDLRYVVDDQSKQMYKARISASNEIVVTVPAYDYNLRNNRDVFANCSAPMTEQAFLDGMDEAIDNFTKNEDERFFRHYRLICPIDCSLSAKTIFSGAGKDEWLELKIVPCDWQHQASGLQGKNYYATWKVADRAKGSRKKGKPNTSNKAVSDAAKLLAGLGINTGTTSMNTGP